MKTRQNYIIERFTFNNWWNVCQTSSLGDASLIAKSLRSATNATYRVLLDGPNYRAGHPTVVGTYNKQEAS
jgi:hypothetical protein